MSSVPPNIPPGQPPYTPHDAKAQWNAYREQQKATYKAQREAWKAQRHLYRGVYSPRVPSMIGPLLLIGIGVVALLMLSGRIPAAEFWAWYGRWWPLALIGAGLVLLGEWALDLRRKTPVRRSRGYVGLLILLALLGMAAAGLHYNLGSGIFGFNGTDEWFNNMSLPEHDNDAAALSQQVASGAIINIQNPRGDISLTASAGTTVEVQAHEIANASSDGEAQKIFDNVAPHITANGKLVQVSSNSDPRGRVNLTVAVPANSYVAVTSGKGDLTIAGLGAGLKIASVNGDTHLNTIAGPVEVHLGNNRNDFSAHQLSGDLTMSGNCNDLTLSAIQGRTTVSGEVFGEIHMENLGGPMGLHTSITDLQVASLPGDLTLDSDDLRLTGAKGMVHLTTHSKDVDLSQIAGDSYVEDRDGRVAVEPAGSYNVEVRNNKGDIELTLPGNVSATVNGRTHNGDIVSEFQLATMGDEDKTINGRIGSGHARIALNTDNGDLRIKRGGENETAPVVTETHKAPTAPGVRHLKAPKSQQPPKTVTQ
jgi:DUF4097 and DUF4098 domain-containing protein YvlB